MSKSDDIPVHILPEVDFLASEQKIAFGKHSISHRINFYAVVWFKEDGGTHFIDFEPYHIKKNHVYLLAKNQIHSIPSDLLPEAKVIVFSGDFYLSIEDHNLRQLFLPFDNRAIVIPDQLVPQLNNLFSLIILEHSSFAHPRLLLSYTSALLFQLYRLADHHLPVIFDKDQRILKLLKLIQEHYPEQQPTSFYADQIGLTTKRANEILKQHAGTTIVELSYKLLLIEAKKELLIGKRTIKEVAFLLGFNDQSYFARFFKKNTGQTPQQFQANLKAKVS